MSLQPQIALILAAMPDLAGAEFTLLGQGWDSLALRADNRLVFKFPKTPAAQQALIREASVLAEIRPRLALAVPDLRLLGQEARFSCHEKLQGDHLAPADYARLTTGQRAALAATLGQFYADIHAMDHARMRLAGALPIKPWLAPAAVRAALAATPPGPLRSLAPAAIDAFAALPADPLGETWGYFDGHGWNMAFDLQRGTLNGVYDFADSGFGPLHQDFAYSGFVARDLTLRIVASYRQRTGRALDMARIDLLTCYLRLGELAAALTTGGDSAVMTLQAMDWAEATRGLYGWGLP